MLKKYIQPGQKLAIKLTTAERKPVIDGVICLDEIYAQMIDDHASRRATHDDAR